MRIAKDSPMRLDLAPGQKLEPRQFIAGLAICGAFIAVMWAMDMKESRKQLIVTDNYSVATILYEEPQTVVRKNKNDRLELRPSVRELFKHFEVPSIVAKGTE